MATNELLRCAACGTFYEKTRGGAINRIDPPADQEGAKRYQCGDCKTTGRRTRMSVVGGSYVAKRTRSVGES